MPQRLTLPRALELLRAYGYDLLIAQNGVQQAAADITQARAIANPQLSGSIGRSFGYRPVARGESTTSWTAGVADQGALADAIFGKRGLRVSVARGMLGAAQYSRDDALRTLEFALKAQYMQAAAAGRVLEFAREVAALYGEVVALTQVRLHAGAVSEAEVAKAQTELFESQQSVTGAAHDLALAKANIAFLVGVRGPPPAFEIDEDVLLTAPPAALSTLGVPALLRIAAEARPDLKAAQAVERSARAALDLSYRKRAPDVVLSVQGYGEGTGQNAISPPTLALGVAITPPLFNANGGEIDHRAAELQEARIDYEKQQAQIALDVVTAYTDYTSSKERLDRMRGGLLDSARTARDLVSIQYQKGAASLLELLDAQRTFISNNLEYLQDLADLRTAVFEMEQALGKEISQ
jgi:cobalt-zinc-cadmium efflux system outer membrane protein